VVPKEETMKLYKVSLGSKDMSAASHTTGHYHVIANSIADAVKKAERAAKGEVPSHRYAVLVEQMSTDKVGLIR
jgi:predicted transcriptional regulator YdeE